MTLACEDDNSKLVEVVTVAHVDNEKYVDNSLVQVNFGQKVKFSRFGKDFVIDVQKGVDNNADLESEIWSQS